VIGSKHLRSRHLPDDRLYERYVAERTGDVFDPPAADHLAECAACQARYAEVAAFADGVRTEADQEIDERFPQEALLAQQSEIARRIEHLGHAARVISFPLHGPGSLDGQHAWHVTPKWVAAAAAAGLFIGVGVGNVGMGRLARTFSHPRTAFSASPAPAGTRPLAPVSGESTAAPAPAASDVKDADPSDEFLAELEFALERPRTRELRALDELTPHVREVSLNNVR
jgi:hypothetical protein